MVVLHGTDKVVEGRVVHVGDRPITFEQFLDITGDDDDLELVKGVLVERMSAQFPYERRVVWLLTLLNSYVQHHRLGVVLGSRSAVKIDVFGGRLPDVLFVRADRAHIIQDKAIHGAPDLVVEVVSANDHQSDIHALETEYRSIGVGEIVFVDTFKRRLLVLRRRENDYIVDTLASGAFQSEAVAGFHFDVDWILNDPLPNVYDLVINLVNVPFEPSPPHV